MGQSPRCATPPAGKTASRVKTAIRVMQTPPLKGICTPVDLLGELRPGEAQLGVVVFACRLGGNLSRPPHWRQPLGPIRGPAVAPTLRRVARYRPGVSRG